MKAGASTKLAMLYNCTTGYNLEVGWVVKKLSCQHSSSTCTTGSFVTGAI